MLFLFGINFAYAQVPDSAPFGATVELDQRVYTWTDKVYITIIAPDHNLDSDLIDQIGDTDFDPIRISTRGFDLDNYKLIETGTDTGMFTGEIILTGFSSHDADGDGSTGDASGAFFGDHGGHTNGLLPADDEDGITVSFEFEEDETVVLSALIRWNEGKIQWIESYNVSDGVTNVVRVTDPDMNLNPELADSFNIDVWSDSDAGGIGLTVTETNVATGIFEGTVLFTTTRESSGNRIRVAEGDTVTAEYEDHTLRSPYTINDELDLVAHLKPVEFADISVNTDKSTYESGQLITVTGTANQISSSVWEKIDFAGMQIVDESENALNRITPDDQNVYIASDLANGQDIDQAFVYLVQIQDSDGDVISSEWVAGLLSPAQSLRPSHSWFPTETGIYFGKILIWDSIDDMTPLSNMITFTMNVGNGLPAFEDVSETDYPEIPLTLKIQHSEGNIVWIDQIAIQNEKFNVVYSSQGEVWKKPGLYNVVVQQLDKKANTTFELTITPPVVPSVVLPLVCPPGYENVDDVCKKLPLVCPPGYENVDHVCTEKPKIPIEIIIAVGGSVAVGGGSIAAYKLLTNKPPPPETNSEPKKDPEDKPPLLDIHVEIRGGLEK